MTVVTLPPAGKIYRAYYFAGAQRVAVRQGSTVHYLLGDHLGSTSVVYNASTGAAVTQLYKPWGEVRYSSAALPTDYTYTGQYSNTADFGLMYYRARWYDPSLGRFAQADTVVPGAGNPMAWDRYAYSLNNPVVYADPSGHFPWIPLIIIGFILVNIPSDSSYHDQGVETANQYMDATQDSIVIAASIAVQSEWYNPIIDGHRGIGYDYYRTGLGIAQVSDAQMVEYGVEGDQLDPAIAIEAMNARIDRITNACAGCNARDRLIAAALAQNGSWITPDFMNNGNMDWNSFFDRFGPKGFPYDQIASGHQNYDTRYMLHKFLEKLRILYQQGWNLPEGITADDLNYIEDLSQGDFK